MYKVNLLQQAYIKNKKNQKIKNRVIYGLIILLVVVILIYRLFVELGVRQAQQLDSMSRANANLADTIRKMSDPESPMAYATEIDLIIDRIEDSGIDYVKYLVLICNSAPDDVLISSLSMSGSGDERACVIQASAERYESITGWVTALGEIDGLDKVTFSYLTAGDINSTGSPEREDSTGPSDRIRFEFRVSITNP